MDNTKKIRAKFLQISFKTNLYRSNPYLELRNIYMNDVKIKGKIQVRYTKNFYSKGSISIGDKIEFEVPITKSGQLGAPRNLKFIKRRKNAEIPIPPKEKDAFMGYCLTLSQEKYKVPWRKYYLDKYYLWLDEKRIRERQLKDKPNFKK